MNATDRNLQALQTRQPDLADHLRALTIPSTVQPATGRDGHPTFRIVGPDGRARWFGGSSMPSISAPEMLAAYSSDGANVVLPGVLTGVEPKIIAERSPAHTAVFVVENDPLAVRLALQLYDYTALIEAGRVLFLLADDLSGRLQRFFAAHPGYEIPTQVVSIPHLTPAQLADLRRRLEEAGARVVAAQHALLQSLAERIAARWNHPAPGPGGVAVIGVDARPAGLAWVRRIARACAALGRPHSTCAPSTPDQCHIVARLRAVESASAGLVLFADHFGSRLLPWLPPNLPRAAWFAPAGAIPDEPFPAAHPTLTVFAADRSQLDRLRALAVPPDSLRVAPPAAAETHADLRAAGATDLIAVLIHAPDDRAAACHLTLPSHQQLWQALRDATRRDIDAVEPDRAEALLAQAERASEVALTDPKLRRLLLGLWQGRVLPAQLAATTVETLAGAGLSAQLTPPLMDAPWSSQTRVVVVPLFTPDAVCPVLDALARGTAVCARDPHPALAQHYPELAELSAHLHPWRTRAELVHTVKRLLADESRTAAGARAAQEWTLTGHTMTHRLAHILPAAALEPGP